MHGDDSGEEIVGVETSSEEKGVEDEGLGTGNWGHVPCPSSLVPCPQSLYEHIGTGPGQQAKEAVHAGFLAVVDEGGGDGREQPCDQSDPPAI